MDVLALVKKAVFEGQLRKHVQPAKVGALLPWDNWESSNKELEAISPRGTVWAVTVRPGGRLWLIARYLNGTLRVSKDRPFYRVRSSPNDLRIQDITDIIGALHFTNRKPLDPRPKVIAHSAQMMGILTPESAAVLRNLAQGQRSVRLIDHSIQIRPDMKLLFSLPQDLTAAEAKRLGAFIMARVDVTKKVASVLAHSPGIGKSAARPTGHRLPVELPKPRAKRGGSGLTSTEAKALFGEEWREIRAMIARGDPRLR